MLGYCSRRLLTYRMSEMAEKEVEVTINATPPRYHPSTVSRIDDMSTMVFDHNIKRKHRAAKKKLEATSTIDRSDGLMRAAINARTIEAAPRYRARIMFLPPINGSVVHQPSMGQTLHQPIAPYALWRQSASRKLKFGFGTRGWSQRSAV